jgi:hypothetical protein
MENEMNGRIPARAAKLMAALLVSTAAVAVMAASAGATPVAAGAPALRSVGSSQTVALIRAAHVPNVSFATEYNAEGYYGAVKCKGKHETNAALGYPGTETEGGRDVERCRSTTGKPLVGLMPDETVELGKGWFPGSSGWNSDYDGQAASEIEYKVSANAKSFKLVAYYPFAG